MRSTSPDNARTGRPSLIAFFSSSVIALTRRRNQTGIDDLTRHGEVTSLPQHGIELLEQSLYRPDRGRPRSLSRFSRSSKSKKPDCPRMLLLRIHRTRGDQMRNAAAIVRSFSRRTASARSPWWAAPVGAMMGTDHARHAGREGYEPCAGNLPRGNLFS
jgi:hypothetical protein